MKNWILGAQIAFLAVGFLAVLEFCFVRGMFTWLLAVAAVLLLGTVNVLLACRERAWLRALHVILTMAALCMGYIVLA